jgi:hypothetical protein
LAPKRGCPMPKSWEQMEGESDDWHGRFLAFLGLGPGRTLIRAYRVCHPDGEGAAVSGAWRNEARARQWQRRANDFDLSTFRETARASAAVYAEAIRHLGAKALEAMASEKPEMRPRDWAEALTAFGYLQALFPSDTLVALVGESDCQGDPPGDGSADAPLEEIPEEAFRAYGLVRPPAESLCPGDTPEQQRFQMSPHYPREKWVEPPPPGTPPTV